METSNPQENVLSLHGNLTLENVTHTWRESQTLLHEEIDKIDLSDVSRVDSAGLALLLEWQSRALTQHRRLQFDSAPEDLVRLAALCEATELLGLSKIPAQNPEAGESRE